MSSQCNLKEALAVRHVAFEDLAGFAPVLAELGYRVNYVEATSAELNELDPLSPDLMIVLGGPIGANDETDYPFLSKELELIRTRLLAGLPLLGICLGAQLLARALGASVYPNPHKEIGWAPIKLTPAGRDSCLADLDGQMVLHWHGDTFDLPQGAIHLASSARCINQAFTFEDHSLALQFHPEATAEQIENWLIGHSFEIEHTPGVSTASLRTATKLYAHPAIDRGRRCLRGWLTQINPSRPTSRP